MKTVTFSDGRKVTFGKRKRASKITGTPYIFAAGSKIELPPGISHGMIFTYRNKTYVALRYSGRDAWGRPSQASYGQPIKLTRQKR